MVLKFKPEDERVRLVFTSEPNTALDNQECVSAVIGPFHSFTDKEDLQNMLRTLLRGYNLKVNSK